MGVEALTGAPASDPGPQDSVKVAVCTQCPSMPAAGTYLPTWINAAMWRWLVMWASDE
jgi:hypothetical protein